MNLLKHSFVLFCITILAMTAGAQTEVTSDSPVGATILDAKLKTMGEHRGYDEHRKCFVAVGESEDSSLHLYDDDFLERRGLLALHAEMKAVRSILEFRGIASRVEENLSVRSGLQGAGRSMESHLQTAVADVMSGCNVLAVEEADNGDRLRVSVALKWSQEISVEASMIPAETDVASSHDWQNLLGKVDLWKAVGVNVTRSPKGAVFVWSVGVADVKGPESDSASIEVAHQLAMSRARGILLLGLSADVSAIGALARERNEGRCGADAVVNRMIFMSQYAARQSKSTLPMPQEVYATINDRACVNRRVFMSVCGYDARELKALGPNRSLPGCQSQLSISDTMKSGDRPAGLKIMNPNTGQFE